MQKGARGSLLSVSEREFVEQGVQQNVRSDGRDRLACRAVETQVGVVPQANGSAVLRCGGTRVLAGVKAEIVVPEAEAAGRGQVSVSVSCSALASTMFEGRSGEDVSAELTLAMNQLLGSGMPEEVYRRLSIGEGHQCWHLYADVCVLDYDGALLDACSMAIYAALANTAIPQVKIVQGREQFEVEALDAADDCALFDAAHVPVYVTLAQIGQRYVADPSALEEACASARISVGVNSEGKLCATHKSEGRGLHPTQLSQMLQAAHKLGQQRLGQLGQRVQKDNAPAPPDKLLERQIFA